MTSINIFGALFQIAFLGVIITTIVFLMKKGLGKANKSKRTYWVMGVYVFVLFLSIGLYLLIPVPKGDNNAEPGAAPSLYDIAYNESPVNIDSDYLKKRWEFDYADNEITIHYRGEDENGIPIRVDKKDKDSKIEATYYQTPTYFYGINLTSHMHPVQVNLTSNDLYIDLPDTVHLAFTSFKKEFPFKQLTNEGFWENDSWMEDAHETYGEHFLYLQVPENIHVKADDDVDISYEGVLE